MIPFLSTHIRYILGKNSYRNNLLKNIKELKTIPISSSKKPVLRVKKIGANGIFLLLIPCGTFCLGTWQVQRRKWKLGLIQELQSKSKEPPIPFPDNPTELEDLEYRKVKICGVFDHDKELYLGPRPFLYEGDLIEIGGGFMASSRSGYNVVTPFTLSNSKLTILVNRGWIPRKYKDPSTRRHGQVSDEVELSGVVRRHEVRGLFMAENMKNSDVFGYRDVNAMARMTGSAPFFLDIVETIEGGPQGSQTRATLRNEHMSYIITWYTLSMFTSFLWFRKFVLCKPLM